LRIAVFIEKNSEALQFILRFQCNGKDIRSQISAIQGQFGTWYQKYLRLALHLSLSERCLSPLIIFVSLHWLIAVLVYWCESIEHLRSLVT